MKLTLRAVAAGTFLTALAAGLTAHPAVAEDIGLDFWHASELRLKVLDSDREARELDRKGERVLRRTAVRAETVVELLAGRMSPEEAARRFAELNRTDPEALAHVRARYRGDTDEQRAIWQLVAHVQVFPDPRAKEVAAEAACRLTYPTK